MYNQNSDSLLLPTYNPFIRFGVVRFQPNSYDGYKISDVSLTDFIQLLPDRTVEITKNNSIPGSDVRSVVIKGLTFTQRRGISLDPDSNKANYGDVMNENSKIVLNIERFNPKLGDFGWEEISVPRIREDSYFFIRSKLNGFVLDIRGANPLPDTIVSTYHPKLTNNDNQLWRFTDDGVIESKLNGFVLDIRGANTAPDTIVSTYHAKTTDNKNQQWDLVYLNNNYDKANSILWKGTIEVPLKQSDSDKFRLVVREYEVFVSESPNYGEYINEETIVMKSNLRVELNGTPPMHEVGRLIYFDTIVL